MNIDCNSDVTSFATVSTDETDGRYPYREREREREREIEST